jgi:signal transduction histidine kinase
VAWTCLPPAAGLHFRADPALLSQALINLLHNAADASAGGSAPLVTLACAGNEDGIAFLVSDNGPGIAPERQEEIFLPFFTTKSGGSGIGLPLARQIALAHGGRLTAEDRPGGGTLFRLTLPSWDGD